MADTSIVIQYAPVAELNLESNITQWAVLEQAEIPNSASEAKVSDVFSMIGYAKNGMTALEYLNDNCSSVSVRGSSIFINLDFYVWVSDMNLPYTLTASNTDVTIGNATRHKENTSFDIIFRNTKAVDLGRLFDGTLKAEMPFFNSDGSSIFPDPSIEIVGSNVVLSKEATVVLRANGEVEGYKHTMTIEIVVPSVATSGTRTHAKYSVTGLETSITVQWGNCDPNDAACISSNSDTIKMDIPVCVDDLISSCVSDLDGDGDIDIDDLLLSGLPSPLSETLEQGESEGKQIVYFSTCSGKILKQFWKSAEDDDE